MSRPHAKSPGRQSPGGFTLTELLIVMGVIATLSVLTLVSVKAIANDARMASATNTVVASLDNARSLAMKNNNLVMVVFKARLDGSDGVVVDIVPCEWTGESYRNGVVGITPVQVIDRFRPIPDAPVRSLPRGIKVAAPRYALQGDEAWATQSNLPATEAGLEVAGVVLGVMYGPDGTTVSNNPQSDSDFLWVDFQFNPADGAQIRNNFLNMPNDDLPPGAVNLNEPTYFTQNFESDEPFVLMAPFLAVYDDDQARELKTGDWSDTPAGRAVYQRDLVGDPSDPETFPGYITGNSTRIHFNRYTGVVMK